MQEQSIREIIEAAGGFSSVASAITAHGKELTPDAVYKWVRNGVPDKHWSVIFGLANVDATTMFAANERARAEQGRS
jgi:hypothetical protein